MNFRKFGKTKNLFMSKLDHWEHNEPKKALVGLDCNEDLHPLRMGCNSQCDCSLAPGEKDKSHYASHCRIMHSKTLSPSPTDWEGN